MTAGRALLLSRAGKSFDPTSPGARLFGPADSRMWPAHAFHHFNNSSRITLSGSDVTQVTSWARPCALTQTTSGNRPQKVSGGGITFPATTPRRLDIPAQTDAFSTMRGGIFAVKADWDGAANATGRMFRWNGSSGTTDGDRQPAFGYNRTTGTLSISMVVGGAIVSVVVPYTNNVWNIFGFRFRTASTGDLRATINGGTEVTTTGIMGLPESLGAVGRWGEDTVNTGWSFDALISWLWPEDDLSDAEFALRMGYAAWEVLAIGAAMPLDSGHTWFSAAPTMTAAAVAAQRPVNPTTPAQWAAENWSATGNWTDTVAATTPGSPDTTIDWSDGVDDRTDEYTGAGPIFSPAIPDTAEVNFIAKGATGDCGSVVSNLFRIAPRRTSAGTKLKSCAITTISFNGRAGVVKTDGIWEVRYRLFKLSAGAPNFRMASWFESANKYRDPSLPYAEIDNPETYDQETAGTLHASGFVHEAPYPWAGDIVTDLHQSIGDVSGLTTTTRNAILDPAKWNISDLRDGNFHTYQTDFRTSTLRLGLDGHLTVSRPKRPEWVNMFWCGWVDCVDINPTSWVGPATIVEFDYVKWWQL